ncbi:hypothetical protein EON80_01175 [bacterium]|nr:MAG: hypothetical protein EON80_01175 [bacterium]
MMNESTLLPPGSAPISRARPKVYLESSVLNAVFGREAEKWKVVRDILDDAREGRIEVVVSALSLIECEALSLSGPGGPLTDFFESEFIVRCNVDPFVASTACRLRGQLAGVSNLTPNLWLHLATAFWEGCGYLMSNEKRLLKLHGQREAESVQIVAPYRPWDAGQMSLTDLEGVMPDLVNPDRRSIII